MQREEQMLRSNERAGQMVFDMMTRDIQRLNPVDFFDLLEKKKMITKEGNRYVYTDLANTAHKYFRKEWNKNENGIMDLVMSEFGKKEAETAQAEEENPAE